MSLPVISRIAGANATGLDPSASLADDLKLDSLGRVELLSALEDQYQIELDEAAITEATTIGDVERIVSQGKSEAVAYPYPRWTMRFPMTWIRPLVYHLFLLPLIADHVHPTRDRRRTSREGKRPGAVDFKPRYSYRWAVDPFGVAGALATTVGDCDVGRVSARLALPAGDVGMVCAVEEQRWRMCSGLVSSTFSPSHGRVDFGRASRMRVKRWTEATVF